MLECEEQILQLEKKIEELKQLSIQEDLDLNNEIHKLEDKAEELRQQAYGNLTPWDKVSMARMAERPTAMDYIDRIIDDFMELHGDRQYKDDLSIVGGIGKLGEISVTIIGQQKGRTTKENIVRNFGMPHPEGYRKALRLMKQAEKFSRPIICLIDTPGAFCGLGAEERGQGEAIARNLMESAKIKTPIISIVIGEGGSGGALALGVADEVWMLEHAVYSILSPEGFASILWKDSTKAKLAAEMMKITAQDLYQYEVIEKIIPEPLGGAHKDVDQLSTMLKACLIEKIDLLRKKDIGNLLEERYKKFRKIGRYNIL